MEDRQFSIRDLLTAVGIVAVGLSCWTIEAGSLTFLLQLVGAALIGAGIFAPFGRKQFGAVFVPVLLLGVFLFTPGVQVSPQRYPDPMPMLQFDFATLLLGGIVVTTFARRLR